MVVQSTKLKPIIENDAVDNKDKQVLCTRDRLLEAIKHGRHLSQEDTEAINTVVREAREGSLNDELHG